MNNKWDVRFLQLAKLVSTWSKDPTTKVGACITDPYNRIISTGYNGFPRNLPDFYQNREHKLSHTIHAENNAILFANRNLIGTTLYCTHPCCIHCSILIIQVGISKVIVPTIDPDFIRRWGTEGLNTLTETGIQVKILNLEDQ
jgi:dCMP deaminase